MDNFDLKSLKKSEHPILWDTCDKARRTFLKDGVHRPIVVVFKGYSMELFAPPSFENLEDKEFVASAMLHLAKDSSVDAIAFVCESWLKVEPRREGESSEKAIERVAGQSIRNDPLCKEALVVTYSERKDFRSVTAIAEILRGKKIRLKDFCIFEEAMGRFSNIFLKARLHSGVDN